MQPLARADRREGTEHSMNLALRYLRWAPDRAVPFTEAAFGHREKWVALEPRAVALVLVDVWNIGWGPAPLVADIPLTEELCVEAGASFGWRVKQLTQEFIVPAVQAARAVGLTVAHINLPDVLRRYPGWALADAERQDSGEPQQPQDAGQAWPPPQWVQTWRDARQREMFDAGWEARAGRVAAALDIPEPCRPLAGELLVASAAQFHRLLRERGVRVLVYAGFWTDACLIHKPGAMEDMCKRGYLCIALRDATTTREHAETLEGLWATHAALDHIEFHLGYTTTTAAFVSACQALQLPIKS
jgi:Isochorismatase family